MPKFIVKLERGDAAWYLEWSTVSDGPTTYGMPLAEFREHMREEYGRCGMRELDQRLLRVEATGTSLIGSRETAETAMNCNRAGDDEQFLTYDEIIDKFCPIPPRLRIP